MDDELKRDQEWEVNSLKKQQKKKSEPEKIDELPVAVQQEIEDLCYFVPKVTNHFSVLDKIGEGTFSSVFLASLKHPNDVEEKFALKHIIPTSHPNRMIAELKCLQLFGGRENVMGVELCLKNKDHLVIIMRYFPHQKFIEYFNTLEVRDVQDYMKNLLIALKHIHRYDIIHRDVKPTNFLHNIETKTYALVDFGLAQDAPVRLREENKDKPPIITLTKPRYSQKENTSVGEDSETAKPGGKKSSERTPLSPIKLGSPMTQPSQEGASAQNSQSPSRGNKSRRVPGPSLSVPGGRNGKHRPGRPVHRTAAKDSHSGVESAKHVPAAATGTGAGARRSTNQTDKLLGRSHDLKKRRSEKSGGVTEETCACYGRHTICTTCTSRPYEAAHRAGTPGFRAPEVLMKHPHQSTAVDIWAAGVILLSLLSGRYPFFRGSDDMVCFCQIVSLLGSQAIKKAAHAMDKLITSKPDIRPPDLKKLCERLRASNEVNDDKHTTNPTKHWPEVPKSAVDLLQRMLDPNPATRISAEQALECDFLKEN